MAQPVVVVIIIFYSPHPSYEQQHKQDLNQTSAFLNHPHHHYHHTRGSTSGGDSSDDHDEALLDAHSGLVLQLQLAHILHRSSNIWEEGTMLRVLAVANQEGERDQWEDETCCGLSLCGILTLHVFLFPPPPLSPYLQRPHHWIP